MCVEGLRAIPLGCSDCYDKGNVPEAERGLGGAGTGGRAGAGPGLAARRLCPRRLGQRRLEEWQPCPGQLPSNTQAAVTGLSITKASGRGILITY